MNCWDKNRFVNDLSNLIHLISKYDIPIELTKLNNIESQFQFGDTFNVNLEDLVFTVDGKISGTNPSNIDMFQIIFTNKFELDSTKNIETQDPIKEYSFQLQILGFDEEMNEYIYWWHLDKNIPSSPPKYTHPYYHFQAGGNELETKNAGQLLLLNAPRIPHPPMDLFLGFHFIVNNFFSNRDYLWVKKLLEEFEYQELIKRAQMRMWEPYFGGFKLDNINTDFTMNNIFPLYIN